MPVQLTDYVSPLGTFPIALDTDLKGGFRSVADTTERDAISTARRVHGMQVFVRSTGLVYELGSDLTTWVAVAVPVQTDAVSIYVNSDTGNDLTGSGTALSPYATIDRAKVDFDALPTFWAAPVTVFLAGTSVHTCTGGWGGRVQISGEARLSFVGTAADVVVASGTLAAPSTRDGSGAKCFFPVGASTERRGNHLKITSGAYTGYRRLIAGQDGNSLIVPDLPAVPAGVTWQIVRPGTLLTCLGNGTTLAYGIGLSSEDGFLTFSQIDFVGDGSYGYLNLNYCHTRVFGCTLSEIQGLGSYGGSYSAGSGAIPDEANLLGLSVAQAQGWGFGDYQATLQNDSYGFYSYEGCTVFGSFFVESWYTEIPAGSYLAALGLGWYANFSGASSAGIGTFCGGFTGELIVVSDSCKFSIGYANIVGQLSLKGTACVTELGAAASIYRGRIAVSKAAVFLQDTFSTGLNVSAPLHGFDISDSGRVHLLGGALSTVNGVAGWGILATGDGQVASLAALSSVTGALGSVSAARDKNALSRANGDISANNQKIVSGADGVAATDFATFGQLTAAINGRTWKSAVRAATTANITLSGAQTIDGVACIAGERVLVKAQSTGANNGLYDVAAGAWTRSTDADTSAEVTTGLSVWVSEGSTLADTMWSLGTNAPIVLGSTALTFVQVGAGGSVTFAAVSAALAAATTDVAFNAHALTGVADPTNSQDAVTKAWALANLVSPLAAVTESADFTLSATHYMRDVLCTKATLQTVTLPSNATWATPIGTFVCICNTSVGRTKLVAGSGATFVVPTEISPYALGGGWVVVKKTGTDEWSLATRAHMEALRHIWALNGCPTTSDFYSGAADAGDGTTAGFCFEVLLRYSSWSTTTQTPFARTDSGNLRGFQVLIASGNVTPSVINTAVASVSATAYQCPSTANGVGQFHKSMWLHVGLQHTGAGNQLISYYNGVPQTAVACTGYTSPTTDLVYLGKRVNGFPALYSDIGGATVYHGVATAAQWLARYQAVQAAGDFPTTFASLTGRHLWSVKQAILAHGNVSPTTINDLVGTNHLTKNGTIGIVNDDRAVWL